jgi:phospholipase/carboxylesterase
VGSPRIYVSHGTRDDVLAVTISRDSIVPSLRRAGYNVTYREFEGYHEVPSEISESALDWFLGQRVAGMMWKLRKRKAWAWTPG